MRTILEAKKASLEEALSVSSPELDIPLTSFTVCLAALGMITKSILRLSGVNDDDLESYAQECADLDTSLNCFGPEYTQTSSRLE